MDATRLQSKVYSGYGKAAQRIGYVFTQYRPATSTLVFNNTTQVATLNAAFSNASQAEFPFNKPNDYKAVLWSGLFDASTTKVGDYLVHATEGTFFIAAQQHLLPNLCVQCSRTFTLYRENAPAIGSDIGLQTYSGVTRAGETTVMSGFPGAMQWAREGQHPYFHDLPSDSPKRIGWVVFLPPIPGAAIRERDFLQDDLGRRYLVMGVYTSDLGYRLSVELMQV